MSRARELFRVARPSLAPTAAADVNGVVVEGGPLSDGIVGVFRPLAEAIRGFFGGTPPTVVVNVPPVPEPTP